MLHPRSGPNCGCTVTIHRLVVSPVPSWLWGDMETLLRYLCPEQSLTSGVVLSKGTLEACCNPYLYLWFDLTHGWLDLTVPSKRKAWPVGWLLPLLDCGISVSQCPMAWQLHSFEWVFCIPASHGLTVPPTWLDFLYPSILWLDSFQDLCIQIRFTHTFYQWYV